MSVEVQEYPINCEHCGSTNTDCSINLGSITMPDDPGTVWDEGWKCRDCGARFPVARLDRYQDYKVKVTNIEWETDDEQPVLPTELAFTLEAAEGDDRDEMVVDWVSELTGWLVAGCDIDYSGALAVTEKEQA